MIAILFFKITHDQNVSHFLRLVILDLVLPLSVGELLYLVSITSLQSDHFILHIYVCEIITDMKHTHILQPWQSISSFLFLFFHHLLLCFLKKIIFLTPCQSAVHHNTHTSRSAVSWKSALRTCQWRFGERQTKENLKEYLGASQSRHFKEWRNILYVHQVSAFSLFHRFWNTEVWLFSFNLEQPC